MDAQNKESKEIVADQVDNKAAGDNTQSNYDKKRPKRFFNNYNRGYRKNYNRRNYRYGNGGDRRYYNKRPRFEVGERLKEVDLGITQYVGDCEGFAGTIKERYTDFHVHEISSDGTIAKLNDQSVPDDSKPTPNIEELKKHIPENVWDQLQNISGLDTPLEVDVTDLDKEQRKCIHEIVKALLLNSVATSTTDKGGKKFICFSKSSDWRSQDKRVDWSDRGGDYVHFILHKVNMDTMDALNQMARVLHIRANLFAYSGTKDRRAKTSQWISIKKVNPKRIKYAGYQVKGAFVGNFKYEKTPLRLGMLQGNKFTIALRNITASDEILNKAIASLRDNGFINYYGLQRFGTIASIPTYLIGKTLLQGKWQDAIDLILKPRDGEQDHNLAEARKVYQNTKDARLAYEKIIRTDKVEAKLLWGLHICGQNNPQGALDMIPRNNALMYLHAYQSLIWNEMVSKRIKEFGLKPIVGDLVYENPESADEDVSNYTEDQKDESGNPSEDKAEKSDNVSNAGEANAKEDENADKKTDEKPDEKTDTEKQPPKVKALSESDLANYSISDVVMPLPGWKIVYPTYAKQWYEEYLETDQLNTDLKQNNKKYTLGGSYRKIVQIPSDLSWKIVRHLNKNDDLIASDLDELKKLRAPDDNPDGKFKALVLEMSLKSSSYATMALREVLKCDTSAQTHAAQSAAFHLENPSADEKTDENNSETDDIHVETLQLKENSVSQDKKPTDDSHNSQPAENKKSSKNENKKKGKKSLDTSSQKMEVEHADDSGIAINA